MKFVSTVLVVFVFLTGCTALDNQPPATYSVDNMAVIDRPFDEVWQSLITLAGERGFPVEVLEADSGFMSFGHTAIDESYLDCGQMNAFFSGPEYEPRAAVNITAAAAI